MSDQLLIEEAMAARSACYCPYSSFPVSAALLADSGKIYTGVNVENASYGLTICADELPSVLRLLRESERLKS